MDIELQNLIFSWKADKNALSDMLSNNIFSCNSVIFFKTQ